MANSFIFIAVLPLSVPVFEFYFGASYPLGPGITKLQGLRIRIKIGRWIWQSGELQKEAKDLMAEATSTPQHHRTIFDGWLSICNSLCMALIGYRPLVGIPAINRRWGKSLCVTELQAGRVAGADLDGLPVYALMYVRPRKIVAAPADAS